MNVNQVIPKFLKNVVINVFKKLQNAFKSGPQWLTCQAVNHKIYCHTKRHNKSR